MEIEKVFNLELLNEFLPQNSGEGEIDKRSFLKLVSYPIGYNRKDMEEAIKVNNVNCYGLALMSKTIVGKVISFIHKERYVGDEFKLDSFRFVDRNNDMVLSMKFTKAIDVK